VSLTFVREPEPRYGQLEEVTPLVRRLVARNPGPFTFHGTGTYVVGRGEVAVVDPGPDLPEHLEAIQRALSGERVSHILVTHTHRDHSPGAAPLAAVWGVPVLAFGPHPVDPGGLEEPAADAEVTTEEPFDTTFSPTATLAHGDVVAGDGWTLEAVHTPGHLPNHLCFALREEHALLSGDHVMGWSTTVVAPPLGDMRAYQASLVLVRDRPDRVHLPTHGPPVTNPAEHVAGLLAHRAERERQVVERLRQGPACIPELVMELYTGLDERLHKAAGRSLLAHLLALRAEGTVHAEGPLGTAATWALAG
jgi:glyoxylase-like metal-dependent hydrolase (beta-lactamase superfamily II)